MLLLLLYYIILLLYCLINGIIVNLTALTRIELKISLNRRLGRLADSRWCGFHPPHQGFNSLVKVNVIIVFYSVLYFINQSALEQFFSLIFLCLKVEICQRCRFSRSKIVKISIFMSIFTSFRSKFVKIVDFPSQKWLKFEF